MPEPYRHTVMEGFIDDYGRIRLFVATAAVVLLVAFAVFDTWSVDRVINAISLLVMALHAGWNLVRGIRSPHFSLALDMTVTGIAAAVVVNPVIAGLSWAFWCVVITFVTYGRLKMVFYAYATLGYLGLIIRADPGQELGVTIPTMFVVAVIVIALNSVNRRMLLLELQRSQLLGSVSHELRNQLTGVMGMIDLALDKDIAPTPDEVFDLIILAKREAADATGVIEDLLTASRLEGNALEVAFEPVDLDLEVAKIVDHYPSEGMVINHTGPRSGVVALADQVRLRQVLRNLLSNAIRYGGKTISISVHPDGARADIRVADDGPGVPAGEEETIFLPYRRAANTPRHKNSVGLGLWISRRLAMAMGGNLTYRHVAGETVFELTLPVYAPPVAARAVPVSLAQPTSIANR